VVFKGSILGGVHQFWGNPYLNSTTVLFDTTAPHYHTATCNFTHDRTKIKHHFANTEKCTTIHHGNIISQYYAGEQVKE